MIYLVEGQSNKVKLRIESAIDTKGFSASLSVCGKTFEFSDLAADNLEAELSAEDVACVCPNGQFAALVVCDAKSKPYAIFSPYFKKIPPDAYDGAGDKCICVTLTPSFEAQTSGGATPVPGDWATKSEVAQAEARCKSYTDEKVTEVAIEALENTEITVDMPDGGTGNKTVKDAVQEVVNMQATVTQIANTKLSGHVVDEVPEGGDGQPDDETLYLTTTMP